jgi:hypothetical protein
VSNIAQFMQIAATLELVPMTLSQFGISTRQFALIAGVTMIKDHTCSNRRRGELSSLGHLNAPSAKRKMVSLNPRALQEVK